MEDKSKSPLAGFTAAVGVLNPGLNSLDDDKEFNENSAIPEVDPEELPGQEKEKIKNNETWNTTDDTDDASDKGTEKEDKKSKTVEKEEGTKSKVDETETSEIEDEDDEAEIVSPFVDLFAEELGWEIDEEEKPKTISELVKYMNDVIEANSKPSFASEEIEALNKFVEEGGDVKEYFNNLYGDGIDPETIDLTKENNQKLVVKENLKQRGYSEDRIKKLIDRYEDAGTLEEEAEDAIELIKENKAKHKEQLLKEQEKISQLQKNQQLKFVKDVQDTVKGINSIRGIPVSPKEKQALLDYVFKPGSDGRTQYQKDYEKSSLNLIESAYFTMKGDALLKKIETKATSDAAKILKEKLKPKSTTKPGKNTRDIESDESLSLFSLAASHLHKPQNFNFN